MFSGNNGLFGNSLTSTTGGGLFGNTGSAQQSQSNMTNSTFGQPTSAPSSGGMFGSMPSGGGLFGAPQQPAAASSSLFGAARPTNTGFFGNSPAPQQSTGLFGSAPAVGGNTGLFSNQAGSVSTTTTPTSTGLFGSAPTGGLFGQQPGTSSTTTNASTGLFGTSGTTGGLFGNATNTTQTSPFQSIGTSQATGSKNIRWREELNRETSGKIQAITYLSEIDQAKSIEEIRWEDYCLGAGPQKATTGTFDSCFGQTTAVSQQPSTNTGGLFGSSTTPSSGGGLFGSSTTQPATGGLFGNTTTQPAAGGLFGSTTTPSGGGLFGSSTQNAPTAFGSTFGAPATKSGGLFGQPSTPAAGGGLFGQQAPTAASSITPSSGGLFGNTSTNTTGTFGTQNTSTPSTGLFGGQGTTTGGGLFGSSLPATTTQPSTGGGLFGTPSVATARPTGLFGSTATTTTPQTGGLFDSKPSTTGGLFGSSMTSSTTGGLFGASAPTTGLFGTSGTTSNTTLNMGADKSGMNTSTGLFGNTMPQSTTGLGTSGGLFGKPTGSSLGTGTFGTTPASTTSGGLFGSTTTGTGSGGIFGSSTGLMQQPLQQTQPSMGLFGGNSMFSVSQQPTIGNNTTNPSLPSTQSGDFNDPYGLCRLSGIYANSVPGAYVVGSLPPIVPNPFAFPASGVILPTQYRRYKSAALAQVWRPLPEHSTNYRRQLLPSLTPKRLLYQRRPPAQSSAGLGADYGWPDYSLAGLLYPTALGSTPPPAASHLGSSTNRNKRYSVPAQRSPGLSVFRQPMYEDESCSPVERDETRGYQTSYRNNYNGSANSYRDVRRLRPKWRDGQDTSGKSVMQYTDQDVCWQGSPPLQLTNTTTPRLRGSGDSDSDENQGAHWTQRSAIHRRHPLRLPLESPNRGDGGGTNRWVETPRDIQYNLSRRTGSAGRSIVGDYSGGNVSRHSYQDPSSITRRTGRLGGNNISSLTTPPYQRTTETTLAPQCTREGYSTKPSYEALCSYPENRLAAVEDFTVIREGFGEITWPGLTDVRGLLVDDIVVIEDKAVEVYPQNDLQQKSETPPVGSGLNKPATITLFNCRPKELAFGQNKNQSIDSTEQYENHVTRMRRYTEKIGGHFISLSMQWVWKFKVDHFSRYAFIEDSDETSQSVISSCHSPVEGETDYITQCIAQNTVDDISQTEFKVNVSLRKKKGFFQPALLHLTKHTNEILEDNQNITTTFGQCKQASRTNVSELHHDITQTNVLEFCRRFNYISKEESTHSHNINDLFNSIETYYKIPTNHKLIISDITIGNVCPKLTAWSTGVIAIQRVSNKIPSTITYALNFFHLPLSSSINALSQTPRDSTTIDQGLIHRAPNDIIHQKTEHDAIFKQASPQLLNAIMKSVVEHLDVRLNSELQQQDIDKVITSQANIYLTQLNYVKQFHQKFEYNAVAHYCYSTWKLLTIFFGSLTSSKDCTEAEYGMGQSLLNQEDNAFDAAAERCSDFRQRLELFSDWIAEQNELSIQNEMKRLQDNYSKSTLSEIDPETLLPYEALIRLNRAFHFLTANNIKEAVSELLGTSTVTYDHNQKIPSIKVPFLRLALCVVGGSSSSICGAPLNHEALFQQLVEWQKQGLYDRIPLPIIRIHHILAGCLDRLVSSTACDWRCALGLLLWYPSPDATLYVSEQEKNESIQEINLTSNHNDVDTMMFKPLTSQRRSISSFPINQESINQSNTYSDTPLSTNQEPTLTPSHCLTRAITLYMTKLLQVPDQTSTPAPLPFYKSIERRPIQSSDKIDFQFHLLRHITHQLTLDDYNQFFDPATVSPSLSDVSFLWIAFKVTRPSIKNRIHSLIQLHHHAKKIEISSKQLCEKVDVQINHIAVYLDRLMITQLEECGLWHWSILILLSQTYNHLLTEKEAIHQLLDIICRNTQDCIDNRQSITLGTDQSVTYREQIEFLLNNIHIPIVIISYSQALRLQSFGKNRRACDRWLDCVIFSTHWMNENKVDSLDTSSVSLHLQKPETTYPKTTYFNRCIQSHPSILLPQCLKSQTSFFCTAALHLLISEEFLTGIEALGSHLIGNVLFFLHAFTKSDIYAKADQSIAAVSTHHETKEVSDASNNHADLLSHPCPTSDFINPVSIPSHLMEELDIVLNDSVSSRRVNYSEDKLLRRSTIDLCQTLSQIATTGGLITLSEWRKSPLSSFCHFISWIVLVIQLYYRIQRGVGYPGPSLSLIPKDASKDLNKNQSQTTSHINLLTENDQTLCFNMINNLRTTAEDIYIIIEDQLKKYTAYIDSCNKQSELHNSYSSVVNCQMEPMALRLIPDNLHRNSSLPSCLWDIKCLPPLVIPCLLSVRQVMAQWLQASLGHDILLSDKDNLTNHQFLGCERGFLFSLT